MVVCCKSIHFWQKNMHEKIFSHFRSQWRPLDLKFAPLVTLVQHYVSTKLEVSTASLSWENQRHWTGGRAECYCSMWPLGKADNILNFDVCLSGELAKHWSCFVYVSDKLPYSVRILLESAVRNCDEFHVHCKDVENILDWSHKRDASVEIPFKPARVILQDFTWAFLP